MTALVLVLAVVFVGINVAFVANRFSQQLIFKIGLTVTVAVFCLSLFAHL